jgi:hypothetical protein
MNEQNTIMIAMKIPTWNFSKSLSEPLKNSNNERSKAPTALGSDELLLYKVRIKRQSIIMRFPRGNALKRSSCHRRKNN